MPKTRPPSRPTSRERILREATRLFNERGYNATGIEDIQRAAGVLRGAMYFHFRGKEELALEVLDGYFAGVAAFLEDRFAATRRGWLKGLFGAFGTVADQTAARAYRGGCLLGNFGQELTLESPKARTRIRGLFERLVAAVARFLKEAQKAGEVPGDLDVQRAARLFVSGFHGALIELKVYKDRRVFDEAMGSLRGLLSDAR